MVCFPKLSSGTLGIPRLFHFLDHVGCTFHKLDFVEFNLGHFPKNWIVNSWLQKYGHLIQDCSIAYRPYSNNYFLDNNHTLARTKCRMARLWTLYVIQPIYDTFVPPHFHAYWDFCSIWLHYLYLRHMDPNFGWDSLPADDILIYSRNWACNLSFSYLERRRLWKFIIYSHKCCSKHLFRN